MNIVFGFWDSFTNTPISNIQQKQISLWAKSILRFNQNTIVKLYTRQQLIPKNMFNIKGLEIIYFSSLSEIFNGTPIKITNPKISKPELSDMVRLALLYKYGGSWIDVDDITFKQFTQKNNVLGVFLWPYRKTAEYWGSTFNLVNGIMIGMKYKEYAFHVQNDPMMNWSKGNKFLFRWMSNYNKYKSRDWGQKLPTELIRKDSNIIKNNDVTLIPQHDLLVHPAFGHQKEFGYLNSKGPLFPPFDLRIQKLPNYDSVLNETIAKEIIKKIKESYDSFIIKNSKNIGIIQSTRKNKGRWLIGFIADINFYDIMV